MPKVQRGEGPVRTPRQSPLVVDRGFLFGRKVEMRLHRNPKAEVTTREDVSHAEPKHGVHVNTPRPDASDFQQTGTRIHPGRLEQALQTNGIGTCKLRNGRDTLAFGATQTCATKHVWPRIQDLLGRHLSIQCRFDTGHHSCGSLDTQLLGPHDAHKGIEGRAWRGQVQIRMPRNDRMHLRILLLHKGTKLFIHSFHHRCKLNIFAP